MSVAEVVSEVEAAGVAFRLDGERVRVRYPDDGRRKELAGQIALLRAHRDEVAEFLRKRTAIPAMPPGVRLVHWGPKPAPIILTQYSVVADVDRFVRMTLLELRAALAGKRWQSGHWSVRDLVDRLEECGVQVAIESKGLDICQRGAQ